MTATDFVTNSVRQALRWPVLAAAAAGSLLLQAAYQIGTALLFKVIFDDGITARRFDVLAAAVGGLFSLLVLLTVAATIQEFAMARLAARVVAGLRRTLFSRIQDHSPGFFEGYAAAHAVQHMGSDLESLELGLVRAVPSALLQSLTVVAALIFLVSIQWRLAIVALASMSAIFFAPIPFARRSAIASSALLRETGALSDMVRESVAAQLTIRLLGLHRKRRSVFESRVSEVEVSETQASFSGGMAIRSTYIAAGFTQIVVVGAGAYFTFRGLMTGGELIAFVGLLLSIGEAVNSMTSIMPLLVSGASAWERVNGFLSEMPKRLESTAAGPAERFERDICFRNVGFSYDNEHRALSGVTLTIRKGELVAFVGPSGCGKSTMLSLALRLNVPGSGEILLDGRSITEIGEESLRDLVAAVPQMPALLSGTVRENLTLGNSFASDADIRRAVERAALDSTILALPQGLETEVGLGGGQLSPGQRQRIVIACALLRPTPILMLDEATSALDPVSEAKINQEILAQRGSRTIVSVTHRLSGVVEFDRICVFEEGRLIEEGRHAQLIEKGGLYKTLWEKQQGFEIDSGQAAASVTPERLRAIPFLSAAGPETLRRFAAAFVSERYAERAAICTQGDPGDKFYILVRGVVDVHRQDDGESRTLGTLTDGDFFGEIALLEDRPRTATIRARTACWCLALPRTSFLTGLDDDPGLAAVIRNAIRDRLSAQRF